jgi:hypothetical protein
VIQDLTKPAAAPCGCHGQQPQTPARLGFTSAPGDLAAMLPDWHWLLIAALAAIVIYQAIDNAPEGRRKRK